MVRRLLDFGGSARQRDGIQLSEDKFRIYTWISLIIIPPVGIYNKKERRTSDRVSRGLNAVQAVLVVQTVMTWGWLKGCNGCP
jgi:hypothetical protein